jgi:ABC-type phosphonate transport system ATPase subunit
MTYYEFYSNKSKVLDISHELYYNVGMVKQTAKEREMNSKLYYWENSEVHPLTQTHVDKVIANYERVGRKVHPSARKVGERMIASGKRYPMATDAVNAFKTIIWNNGLIS